MKQFKILLLLVLAISLAACSKGRSGDDIEEQNGPFKGVSAKQLYLDAKQSLAKKQYESATKQLEALDTKYPFNDYAEQAELDLIYAYYKNDNFASAAATAERYIHLYPRSKRVDYAYYMKGLANFQQPRGTMTRILPVEESWRDPGTQSQAYSDFATFIQRFPNSRYKPNALQRMIYLRNEFAKHELNIANYYFTRRMYVAATERANYLIKNYSQAPSAQPALEIVYHANMKMGLKDAANEALKVYQATYHKLPEQVA